MPYKDYTLIKFLKHGGTSRIFKVQDNDTGELRVMKITSFLDLEKSIWLNEIKMLEKFQYLRGVVKMIEYGEIQDGKGQYFGYLILELCEDDLREKKIQPGEIKKLFLFLYRVLTTIHSMGYCYCDLKLENILRQGQGFKLCDFSSCQPLGTMTNVLYGTLHLMAPELIPCIKEKKNFFYDEKIDTWGVGCVLYEIITGKPVNSLDEYFLTTITDELQNSVLNISTVERLTYQAIVQLCLSRHPAARPRLWELSEQIHRPSSSSYCPLLPLTPRSSTTPTASSIPLPSQNLLSNITKAIKNHPLIMNQNPQKTKLNLNVHPNQNTKMEEKNCHPDLHLYNNDIATFSSLDEKFSTLKSPPFLPVVSFPPTVVKSQTNLPVPVSGFPDAPSHRLMKQARSLKLKSGDGNHLWGLNKKVPMLVHPRH